MAPLKIVDQPMVAKKRTNALASQPRTLGAVEASVGVNVGLGFLVGAVLGYLVGRRR